jgi:hypothetical protein
MLAAEQKQARTVLPDPAESGRLDERAQMATNGRSRLVACVYVHVAGSVEEMVRRMGAGVAPGGTLLLVGHRPFDPDTGAATPAAGQVQVSVETAIAALDQHRWRSTSPKAAAGPTASNEDEGFARAIEDFILF